MLSPAECRSRLSTIVDASIEAASDLQKSLQDERRALERQDSGALGAATESKRQCTVKLEALEKERRGIGVACGKGPGPEQMSALLADLDAACRLENGLADGWQRFLALAARCKELNTTNGAIIHLRHRQFSAALRIVSGSRSQAMETYGPNGGASAPRSPRTLAEI